MKQAGEHFEQHFAIDPITFYHDNTSMSSALTYAKKQSRGCLIAKNLVIKFKNDVFTACSDCDTGAGDDSYSATGGSSYRECRPKFFRPSVRARFCFLNQ